MSGNIIWLDKNYGTWKGLKTNIIKLEEDYVYDSDEFGRDDKDIENFVIQPDVQSIIVEEKPIICSALRKTQTFYNDAPEATTIPLSLKFGRELNLADSGRE